MELLINQFNNETKECFLRYYLHNGTLYLLPELYQIFFPKLWDFMHVNCSTVLLFRMFLILTDDGLYIVSVLTSVAGQGPLVLTLVPQCSPTLAVSFMVSLIPSVI